MKELDVFNRNNSLYSKFIYYTETLALMLNYR